MQMKLRNKKVMSLFFCMMLMVSMAVNVMGCGSSKDGSGSQAQVQSSEEISSQAQTESAEDDSQILSEAEDGIIGEGAVKFFFTVVDKDGNETDFEVHTDKEIVGDALLEAGLIAGDEEQYGLYVKTVNGITVDYDTDGTYWAFYINGEYASSGVDTTAVEEGAEYTFKVEK